MGDKAHWVAEEVAQLFSSLAPNLDLVFVAVVVCEVERGQARVAHHALEKMHCSLSLDVIPAKAQMDERLVAGLEDFGELLEASVRKTILAQIKLSELGVILDDLADDVDGLVAESHVAEVEFARCRLSVVLDDQVEEAEHLLLGRVNY